MGLPPVRDPILSKDPYLPRYDRLGDAEIGRVTYLYFYNALGDEIGARSRSLFGKCYTRLGDRLTLGMLFEIFHYNALGDKSPGPLPQQDSGPRR